MTVSDEHWEASFVASFAHLIAHAEKWERMRMDDLLKSRQQSRVARKMSVYDLYRRAQNCLKNGAFPDAAKDRITMAKYALWEERNL